MCDVTLLSVAQIPGLARIVGPQVPETVHGIVSETLSPTAWVLGPSGLVSGLRDYGASGLWKWFRGLEVESGIRTRI